MLERNNSEQYQCRYLYYIHVRVMILLDVYSREKTSCVLYFFQKVSILPVMNIFDYEASFDSSLIIPQVTDTLQNLSERMAKITQAIILVTSIVPSEQDTFGLLKQFSRQTIIMLSDIQNIESHPDRVRTTDIQRLLVQVKHTAQFNELSHSSGLVSDMNYTILREQFQKLAEIIDQRLMTYCIGQVSFPFRVHQLSGEVQTGNQGVSLENYFTDHSANTSQRELGKKTPYVPQAQSTIEKDTTKKSNPIIPSSRPASILEKDNGHTNNRPTTVDRPIVQKIASPTIIPNTNIAAKNGIADDKKERRDAIMKTIRSKGTVTIKDISENITGCSEKTIQRDLQELIQHGVLIREGEKRWAVYKLAMKNI